MAVHSNIISDLCTYTRVPPRVLNDLVYKEELCIGNAIHDAILAGDDVAILNIGFGTLSVELSTKQCKFIPSRELKGVIKKSIDQKVDPVEIELEQAIIDKLMGIYGEVFGDDGE